MRQPLTSLAIMAAAMLFVHWLVNQLWHEQPLSSRDIAQALVAAIVGSAIAKALSERRVSR
jgi:hypothetical protein